MIEPSRKREMPFVPESATEAYQRKRELSRRRAYKATLAILRYLACLLPMGVISGGAQFIVGLHGGLPFLQCSAYVLRAVSGTCAGVFVGAAFVSFLIISPILPLGPLFVTRDPNARSTEQWEAELGLLPFVGALFSVFGTLLAVGINANASADPKAGIIGLSVGVCVSLYLLIRMSKRKAEPSDAPKDQASCVGNENHTTDPR